MDKSPDFVDVFGSRLEVRQIPVVASATASGSALAPIVFLHEGLGSVAQWQQRGGYWPEQVCAATGRAGLVYSRRGYGQSDAIPDVRGAGRLPPDYLHREAWDVLPALLAATGIRQPVLLGHSDGGSIALLHASRFPVAACIVMAPHVIVEDLSVQAITQARDDYLRTAGDPKGLRARLARHHADVDCAFWQWSDVWLSDAFRSFDIRPDCRRISAPLLAIQGLDDPYGTMTQIDSIEAAIFNENAAKSPPNGPVVLQKLEHCGHAPQKDQPQRALGLVREFLAGLA